MLSFLKRVEWNTRREAHRAATALLLALLGLVGCSHHSVSPLRQAAAATAPALPSPPLFQDVADRAGLHYRWTIPGKRPLNILQTIGNGCAFLDYDNDGNLDILLVGPKLALFRGDGHGHFTDVTHQTGLDTLTGDFLGCAVGDYDNDGYEDIYITAYRGGILLHNEASPSGSTATAPGRIFRNVTSAAKIAPQPWGTSAAFVDVDGDGKLDLVICNYVVFGPNVQPQMCNFGGVLGSCGPKDYKPEFAVYYHNLGGGTFRDETEAYGLRKLHALSGKSLGIACADYNGSGKQS